MQSLKHIDAKIHDEQALLGELEQKWSVMFDEFLELRQFYPSDLPTRIARLKTHIEMLCASYSRIRGGDKKTETKTSVVTKDPLERTLVYVVRKLTLQCKAASRAEMRAIRKHGEFDYGRWHYDVWNEEIAEAREHGFELFILMLNAKDLLFSHRRRFREKSLICYNGM